MSNWGSNWRVDLICCGRDDGYVVREHYTEANDFRNSYINSTHIRQAIISSSVLDVGTYELHGAGGSNQVT